MAAYRRLNAKSGKRRRIYTFQAQTATGWKQLSSRTDSRDVAQQIEAMWRQLAGIRAWDVLGPVLEGERSILTVFDAWNAAGRNAHVLRRLLADTDLEPLVATWAAIHERNVKGDSAAHALAHVRVLFPKDAPRLASQVTTAWLSEQLYAYPGKRNTLRKVASSWSVFLDYCTRIRGLFPVNPMDAVPRPDVEATPIRFYELEAVERIIGAQPTAERRAFFTLLYSTAIEVSTALQLTRGDIDLARKEIRGAGTKAYTRDRICRVAEWAWPTLAAHVHTMLPTAGLWPAGWSRWTVSDWHRETVKALKLPPYPLHNARDHWAVRQARAGTPVAVIQRQLGHGSPMLTLTKYGRFLPDAADRDHWEQEAGRAEARRREAK
jgi:integrase